MSLTFWLLLSLNFMYVFCGAFYCLSNINETNFNYFGSKSAYKIHSTTNESSFEMPNCEISKVWLLIRHGTRLPTNKTMNELRKLENLRVQIIENNSNKWQHDIDLMCDNDYQLFLNWKWCINITDENISSLEDQGRNEMRYLAKRFKNAFTNLLNAPYDKNDFIFRHTYNKRTEDSFVVFVEEMFNKNATQFVQAQPPVQNETLLLPQKYCDAWLQERSSSEVTEYDRFESSDIFQNMMSNVSRRLRINNLTCRDTEKLFNACRYESAWQKNEPHAWCSAFTESDFAIMEYFLDLRDYYKDGYGSQINEALACELVQDLYKHLESNEKPNFVAYFSHSVTLRFLLTAIGFAKDLESLRADNFDRMESRQWRMTKLTPFAANIAFVKYFCPNEIEREQVKIFLNEKPIELSWCKNEACSLTDFIKKFGKNLENNCANNCKIPSS